MSDEKATELNDEQAELARRYGLSAEDVKRVRGETWAEKCADAERLSNLAEPQSIRERARRHLQAMQDANPNVGEVLALSQDKQEAARRLVEAVHPDESEPAAQTEGPPDFDGGARQSAPEPRNADAEHSALVVELLRAKRLEGGEQW
jgi:hypothetical protein